MANSYKAFYNWFDYLKNKKVQKINKIDSIFYAGINDEGFYKYDSILNKFNSFLKLGRSNGEIYQIEKGKSDNIMFISSSNSFIKSEKITKKIRLNYDDEILSSTNFKNIIDFKNKNYYIAGGYLIVGDTYYDKAKLFISKEGLLHSVIFKQNLYFGGSGGLYVKKIDSLVRIKSKNDLLQVSISNFLSTKENLYVGTDGRGVFVYNSKEVIHLKNTDGYSVQKIINKGDDLWIATNKGIHQISLNKNDLSNSKIINSFYETDGLLQNNTNDIYLEGNQLFAASDDGIAQININDIIYKQKPKLYFKTKKDTLSFAKEARNNISITYVLQDFTNQEYVKYQYRLLPSQKKWATTQTKILNFANLSPDLYQLEVKATDQHFNQSIDIQYINVIPTWWQTTFAKIGFGVFGLICLFMFVKVTQKQIQKKEESKAQLDKKIAGLELQALRSQMNPHFVHNSLNAIQYFIQRNEVELSEKYLVKFSKLVRLFFDYSRRKTVSIAEELALLENYLQIEKLRFEEKISFIIKVDERIDAEE